MKPSKYYRQDVASGKTSANDLQEQVLVYLDQLYDVLENQTSSPTSFTARIKKIFRSETKISNESHLQGLYLWGSVGRGKTYLMDLFYQSLSAPKLRQHFYEFMASIHEQLKLQQGQNDPLRLVAQEIAKRARVLCFDEFFVEDIADAMILGTLLRYLIDAGVVIVTTSNVAPDNLYEDGLQRDRFLPAIETIKAHLKVMHLDHAQDYRLTKELRDHRYHFPLQSSLSFLNAHFDYFNQGHALLSNTFKLNAREVHTVKRAEQVIWFEFSELCASHRSSLDYLKLCKDYKTILLANVPILNTNLEDAARRFITLVDTCYDAHVLLIITAAAPLDELYQGELLKFEFARVKSRIIEMQSWV